MLANIASSSSLPTHQVIDLRALANHVSRSFINFGSALSEHGFNSLLDRMWERKNDSPIHVIVDRNRIVGAIGPLQVDLDPVGVPYLLPQYFGVLEETRRSGVGRSLWRSAVMWGRANGATYQILQSEIGSAAEQFFLSEGLETLGYVIGAPSAIGSDCRISKNSHTSIDLSIGDHVGSRISSGGI
jgi:GNAT superfamily N-acetyltransferase